MNFPFDVRGSPVRERPLKSLGAAAALLILLACAPRVMASCAQGADLAAGFAAPLSGGTAGGGTERLRGRVNLSCEGEQGLGAALNYELASAWSAKAAAVLVDNPRLRLWDTSRTVESGGARETVQNLDRLYLQKAEDSYRVVVGRQAIGHGSGRFFNSSDIFAPANPRATWSEYKGGVDAVRLTLPLGELSEVEGFAVAHESGARNSYYLARVRHTTQSLGDYSVYAGSTLHAPTIGLDVAFDLMGAGVYLDCVGRFDRAPGKTSSLTLGTHFQAVEDFDVLAELHYSGPGGGSETDYGRTLSTREWKNGELFVLGRNYGVAGFSWAVHPLVTVRANLLANLGDDSVVLMPALDWWVTEYVTLAVGGSANRGRRGSEFGGAPDFAFMELRANL